MANDLLDSRARSWKRNVCVPASEDQKKESFSYNTVTSVDGRVFAL